MKRPEESIAPDWKQSLGLGEQIFQQADVAAQCHLIAETLQTQLGGQVQVWLVEPFTALPDEPEMPTLPGAPAPALVRFALAQRAPACLPEQAEQPLLCNGHEKAHQVALPLIAQGSLMAMLHLARPEGAPFSTQEWEFLSAMAAHAAAAMLSTRQAALKHWRYEQLMLVRSVMAQVANVHDVDQLCRRITHLILESFHFYHVSIFTVEADHPELLLRTNITRDRESEFALNYTVLKGQGMIGAAAQTGEEQIAQNVREHPQFRYFDQLDRTRSEAALPLKIEERILGVLDVESDRQDAFHENDMLVLRALADGIALALEGARLYNHQKRRADQISALIEITHVLTSILDNLDHLLEEVVKVIQKRFGYQYVHLFSVHLGRRTISYLTGSGQRSERMRLMDLVYDLDGPVGVIPFAARSGSTYLANDVAHDAVYVPSVLPPDDTQAELAIPLKFRDEVLGVLDLQSAQANTFSPEDVSMLEALSAGIAIAYHNATLYRSEQWRRQVADSFRDVASLLSANVPLDRLMDTILTELDRSLPCDAAAIWLVEGLSIKSGTAGHALRLAAVHGISPEIIQRVRDASGMMHSWLSSALGQTAPSTRQAGDPLGPLGMALGFPQDYSSIVVPLRAGDEPLGVALLAHHTPNRYGPESTTILRTYASYAAVAIHNARLYNDAQAQAWLSTILLQVAEASQSANSVDELLSSMMRLTRLLVGIKICAIYLWDALQEVFVLADWYGFTQPPEGTRFTPAEVPAITQLRLNRSMVYLQDATAELSLPPYLLPANKGNAILLPLLTRDDLQGAILVIHQTAGALSELPGPDPQTLSILQGISHQTAIALENLHLLEARQEEAYVTAVLLQVAQAVVSQNELGDILDTIVHLMPILVGIDASVVCLWDSVEMTFHTAQVYAGSRQLEDDLYACAYTHGAFQLLEQVQENDAPFYCKVPPLAPVPQGWFELQPYPISQIKNDSLAPGEDWLLGFPLSVKGELFGVLLAKESGALTIFHERRLEIITGIAQQAALAIQNERLTQEMVVRERLEREIQLAREIQRTFLPSRLPRWEGWQIGARWQTAREVGGDFYDIFHLNRGRIGMAIADVSDKGLAAALYMTVARTLIRAYAQNARSAAKVLQRANHPLVADTPHSMYVTAVFAMLDPKTGQLEYANAGHNRPLLLRHRSQTIEELPKGGMALGVLSRLQLNDHAITLEPGDCLVFFTDGVTETFSNQGEAYGQARLLAVLQAGFGKSVESLLADIESSLVGFRGGAPVSDDMTLLAIRRLEIDHP